jgi:predicted  nucleic acid-binding Zn-ribbon protein
MHWWIITVVCICSALLIQYFCSSKLLRMKQQISIKSIALRDAREQGSRLEEQESELKNQQTSLAHSIDRLKVDIRRLRVQIKDKGLPVPEPGFSLESQEQAESEDNS